MREKAKVPICRMVCQKLPSGTATPPAVGLPPMPRARAIMMPPQTTKGIMWETPAIKAA